MYDKVREKRGLLDFYR